MIKTAIRFQLKFVLTSSIITVYKYKVEWYKTTSKYGLNKGQFSPSLLLVSISAKSQSCWARVPSAGLRSGYGPRNTSLALASTLLPATDVNDVGEGPADKTKYNLSVGRNSIFLECARKPSLV